MRHEGGEMRAFRRARARCPSLQFLRPLHTIPVQVRAAVSAAGRNEMAVTAIEIRSREPYEGGARFGDTGVYERIDGTLQFAVDPLREANRVIVDLDKAPRAADGMVHFSAGFCVLQPVDPAKANRRLLFD